MSTPTENLKVTKTFQAWMDDHANFRTICEEGKGNFKNIGQFFRAIVQKGPVEGHGYIDHGSLLPSLLTDIN